MEGVPAGIGEYPEMVLPHRLSNTLFLHHLRAYAIFIVHLVPNMRVQINSLLTKLTESTLNDDRETQVLCIAMLLGKFEDSARVCDSRIWLASNIDNPVRVKNEDRAIENATVTTARSDYRMITLCMTRILQNVDEVETDNFYQWGVTMGSITPTTQFGRSYLMQYMIDEFQLKLTDQATTAILLKQLYSLSMLLDPIDKSSARRIRMYHANITRENVPQYVVSDALTSMNKMCVDERYRWYRSWTAMRRRSERKHAHRESIDLWTHLETLFETWGTILLDKDSLCKDHSDIFYGLDDLETLMGYNNLHRTEHYATLVIENYKLRARYKNMINALLHFAYQCDLPGSQVLLDRLNRADKDDAFERIKSCNVILSILSPANTRKWTAYAVRQNRTPTRSKNKNWIASDKTLTDFYAERGTGWDHNYDVTAHSICQGDVFERLRAFVNSCKAFQSRVNDHL